MKKLKVGDRVVVEAQVRRVDERTFEVVPDFETGA